MKINTNFISPPGKFAPHLAIMLNLLSVALVLFAIFLWVQVGHLHQQVPALKNSLAQFKSRPGGVADVALPPRAELATVKASIASINHLSGAHNGSLLSALVGLEAQLPPDVSLIELSYRRRAGEIQMTADAGRSETVGKLLRDLERSEKFTEVLLVRQAANRGNNSGHIQFELHLKERP